MLKFTLDTNCHIALEEDNPDSEFIQRLIDLHQSGKIEIAVPAVAASENQRSGACLESFHEFLRRLERLGLSDLSIIDAIGYYGFGFYGRGYYADDRMVELERKIHSILHPSVAFELAEYLARAGPIEHTGHPLRKWLNAKCDVLALWSHIWHERDCFVTSDGNHRKATKLPRLLSLDAREIRAPRHAVALAVGQS